MVRRFRKPKRVLGHLLMWQVFRQEDDELLNTSHTLFIFSLTLLFISILLTTVMVTLGHLSVDWVAALPFHTLDDYGLYAVFFLMLSTLLSVLIKAGSFERIRARLVWVSFLCILTGLVMLSTLLISLVA